MFVCFFYENYHYFSFLKILGNRSLKKLILGFNEACPESQQQEQK